MQQRLASAEESLANATADRSQLQQELRSKSDQLMLMQSELKLKSSRMDAAQQQLAAEAGEHEAQRALLQKQLEQLKVQNVQWLAGDFVPNVIITCTICVLLLYLLCWYM